jgi:tetratricopeptide (TPR) repeat protein
MRPSEIFAAVSTFAGTPLVVYREALCRTTAVETLQALLTANPRFIEIAYSLGLAALGSRPRPKLDEAEEWFGQAYAWRPKWPALTLAMGGVAMTAEDFDRARALCEETLALDRHSGEALLGSLRALTYLGAAADAIAVSDRMLAEGVYVGDARYWRAYNELQLSRLDEAWDDVEQAERALVNASVPKLAGLIAYRRQELEVAIARFTTSLSRNPFDCETQFYLGLVHADLRQWTQTADVLTVAAKCLASAELELTEDIAQIRQSSLAEDRKVRQIARREQQIAEGRRRVAASWFDIAVADFSLSKKDEAREYAQKVSDDEQFGERARELLARLR